MNHKLLKASMAGVAALAVAAGGTTFAAWSDFGVVANDVGADALVLELDARNGSGTEGFHEVQMAPGVNREFDFIIASRPGGEVVPSADLNLQLVNLDDSGDTVTSNSEDVAEDGLLDGVVSPEGEFDDEAVITINASNPTTSSTPCSEPRGSRQSSITLRDLFNATATSPVNLLPAGTVLKPGEKVCVGMGLQLPKASATDASQGDQASFDLLFNLIQNTTVGYSY
jgi:hypothetical protein